MDVHIPSFALCNFRPGAVCRMALGDGVAEDERGKGKGEKAESGRGKEGEREKCHARSDLTSI